MLQWNQREYDKSQKSIPQTVKISNDAIDSRSPGELFDESLADRPSASVLDAAVDADLGISAADGPDFFSPIKVRIHIAARILAI